MHGLEAEPQEIYADGEPITDTQFDPEGQTRTLTFETDLFHIIEAVFQ